eukprot:349773-Prorocentrum_minimum.AAC.1
MLKWGQISGVLCAPLPLLAQEDPWLQGNIMPYSLTATCKKFSKTRTATYRLNVRAQVANSRGAYAKINKLLL